MLMPKQQKQEWGIYLDFIKMYFKARNIKHPFVVEIGVYDNNQKAWYESMGFRHIGIDIRPETNANIVGNSNHIEAVNALHRKLDGQPINLLFIDGRHSYSGVRTDYNLYGILTKNIIAIHDVINRNQPNVRKFWNELIITNNEVRDRTFITIQSWPTVGSKNRVFDKGIGLVMLEDLSK